MLFQETSVSPVNQGRMPADVGIGSFDKVHMSICGIRPNVASSNVTAGGEGAKVGYGRLVAVPGWGLVASIGERFWEAILTGWSIADLLAIETVST